MTHDQSRPFRVLVSAYVDLNVIDGSAFFVAGVASLLTSAPGMAVHVVAATPLRRPVVVQEMLLNSRVTLTDPFRDQALATRLPELRGATRMDEAMSARVLSHYLDHGRYDVVVVRSTEVAHALSDLRPDLGSRLCVYVRVSSQTTRMSTRASSPGSRPSWTGTPPCSARRRRCRSTSCSCSAGPALQEPSPSSVLRSRRSRTLSCHGAKGRSSWPTRASSLPHGTPSRCSRGSRRPRPPVPTCACSWRVTTSSGPRSGRVSAPRCVTSWGPIPASPGWGP